MTDDEVKAVAEADERKRIQAWYERDIESELRTVGRRYRDAEYVTSYAITCIARTEKEARYWKSLYQIESEARDRRVEENMRASIEVIRLRQRIEELEALNPPPSPITNAEEKR